MAQNQNPFQAAMADRAVRTIKAELHYLVDMGLVSPTQLTTFLSALPTESTPSIVIPVSQSNGPLSNGMSNMSLNEKQQDTGFYAPPPQSSTPNPAASPPPMYGSAAPPQQNNTVYLAQATSLYAYNPTDNGDLTLQAGDRVSVIEYMNEEWWKGKSERTGEIGIFPRSYVQVNEGAAKRDTMPAPQQQQQPFMYGGGQQQQQQQQQAQTPMNYGNMAMAVAQNPQAQSAMGNPKVQEMGKKFGSKLGNAAIFGAGATLGADLVNSIF